MRLRNCLFTAALLAASAKAAPPPLKIYSPIVKENDIYFYNPDAKPVLKYNHDVDIVKFKGRFFAAWNANGSAGENKPGQFDYLSASDDFEHWSIPVRIFCKDGGCENPVETDNQWQPNFINWRDQTLFCTWCDFNSHRTFIASSSDGLRWRNHEVPTAPPSLAGKVVGFPTNHGLRTRNNVMLFPCSFPPLEPQFSVGRTRYAGMLRSEDGGETWTWSEPIEAETWAEAGESPAEFGGDTISLWEPAIFEQGDGKIGLLIRNSTAQENPERTEKPHRMLLYATSGDAGRTWTKARPVEVDTICSRNYSVAGAGAADSLMMVMNDNNVRIPERISHDRYFLSLYCAPVCDPDLLLPGPLIQPQGGAAFYPNGFVDDGKLYVAYTYPQGIHSSMIEPLPDFSTPFLLPRGGRSGLRLADGIAYFGHRQTSLGLVLTETLTHQPRLRLAFDLDVHRYNGGDWPLATLGGKTKNGAVIRAIYSTERQSNLFQVSEEGGKWRDLGPFKLKDWSHFEVELTPESFSVSVNSAGAQSFSKRLLRKICFGGLYVPPEWPMGVSASSDVRLKLESIIVE